MRLVQKSGKSIHQCLTSGVYRNRAEYKWVTDIMSIPMILGWLNLAVILDVYSRTVGWSMSDCCDEIPSENALDVLNKATTRPTRLSERTFARTRVESVRWCRMF